MKTTMLKREWVLLVLGLANKPLSPVQLQKSLFIVGKKLDLRPGKHFYKFEPYDYGPFSAEIYQDAEAMETEGLVTINYAPNSNWRIYTLASSGREAVEAIKSSMELKMVDRVSEIVNSVTDKNFRELVTEIYDEYPEYRANSVFKE